MMVADARIQVRTDSRLCDQAEALFKSLGLDMGSAINMFLAQSVQDRGLPFTPRLTAESALARWEAETGLGQSFAEADELKAYLHSA